MDGFVGANAGTSAVTPAGKLKFAFPTGFVTAPLDGTAPAATSSSWLEETPPGTDGDQEVTLPLLLAKELLATVAAG